MPIYVDGFVIPVPKNKIDAYREMASKAADVWIEHGALEFRECVGDDFAAQGLVAFPALTQAKPDETVVFSWIAYASKEDRDRINAAVMKDERMSCMMDMDDPPFDCARMAYGGFRTIVERSKA